MENRFNGLCFVRYEKTVETVSLSDRVPYHRAKATVLMRSLRVSGNCSEVTVVIKRRLRESVLPFRN